MEIWRKIVMKHKKLWIGLLALLMMVVVSGCSLAKEEIKQPESKMTTDRLIGVLITRESLNLIDWENHIEENLEEIIENGSEILDTSDKTGARIYATINKNGSEEGKDWEIVFENIEGIQILTPTFQNGTEGELISIMGDDEISDIQLKSNAGEDGVSRELVGTVYVLPSEGEEMVFYANPIYQTTSGEIYVTNADMGTGVGNLGAGISATQTIDAEASVTRDDSVQTDKMSVVINYEVVKEPKEIILHYMDMENQVITSEKYEPSNLPEKIIPTSGTAYIILETISVDSKDGSTREVYEPSLEEQGYLKTFIPTENGYLVKQEIKIMWENKAADE